MDTSQKVTGMSAPFQHRTRIYALEILACGHAGQRGYPATIQARITQGQRRRCPQCAGAGAEQRGDDDATTTT